MTARAASLALFDLDGTLLPIDSDHAWGEFMVALGWVDGDALPRRNDEFYAALPGRHARHRRLRRLRHRAAGATRRRASWPQAHARFMREVIAPALGPTARALVRGAPRRAATCVAIVTATNEFVTAPIAAAFGVDAR